MLLTVRNGSNTKPTLTTSSSSDALMRSRCSAAGRSKNLCRRLIPDFYESFLRQLLQQREQVVLAALRYNFVLLEEYVPNLTYGSGLLDKLPNPRSYFIQTIVNPDP